MTPHSQLAALALTSLAAVQLKLDGTPSEKTQKALQTSVVLSDKITDVPTCMFQLQLLACTFNWLECMRRN